MAQYSIYDDMPPCIDYEELARQAGYSEEDIQQMFGEPVEYVLFEKESSEPVEIQEQNLMSPLEDIPF